MPPVWVRRDGHFDGWAPVLGVVFVHGIKSSPEIWDAFAELLATDDELAGVVAEPRPRFSYATGVWRPWWRQLRVIPSITTAADSLKEFLVTEAGAFDRLMLVGHSQGGLVIQRCLVRMLSEGRGKELTRIRRVVLLATPNSGSQLLLTARRFLVSNNPQEKALRPYDELVADTLASTLRDVVNAPEEPSERSCRIAFSVYAGEEDGVVTRSSAQATFPRAAALPGDHFTIVRPESNEHRSYTTLKRLMLLAAADGDPPAETETVTTLGPAALEVHNAVEPSRAIGPGAPLTTYVLRKHDRILRETLGVVLAGGPSRIVFLTGESSTGKTRALYEALLELAPNVPLLRPADATDLLALLDTDRVKPNSVLWLNEAQRFIYGASGERASARLRTLLERATGIAVVATLWIDPYWNELMAAPSGDRFAQVKALLAHPAAALRIEVPAELSADDLERWQNLAKATAYSDPRLDQALRAGANDGRVVQHLSGGPELLAAFVAGPGAHFTPREHALLTAALDASRLGRRFGQRTLLPAALLAQAADGALPARHRVEDPNWAEEDLRSLSTGLRRNGSRTDIRATLTALTAVRECAGVPALFEPADYLVQHARRLREGELGSPSLWRALLAHTTDPEDLESIAHEAWQRGLRKMSVSILRAAILAGGSASRLIWLGSDLDPDNEVAIYVATHVNLVSPSNVATVLSALARCGSPQAISILLDRDPAGNVDPANARATAALLGCLRDACATQAIATLADRAATYADVTDPYGAHMLIKALSQVGAHAAAEIVANRAAAHTDLTNPLGVVWLMTEIRKSGMINALTTLMERNPAAHVRVAHLDGTGWLLRELRDSGASEAVRTLLDRNPLAQANLSPADVAKLLYDHVDAGRQWPLDMLAELAAYIDLVDAGGVASLISTMRGGGLGDTARLAARTLLSRDPAAHVDLDDPGGVAWLLKTLDGDNQAVQTLLGRDPAAHVDLDDPGGVAWLLETLQAAEATQAVQTLLDRDPAAHANLIDPARVAKLLKSLQAVEAIQAVGVLAERAAMHAQLTAPGSVATLVTALHEIGATEAVAVLAERAATHVGLADKNGGVGDLLDVLRAVGATDAAVVLAKRAAACVDVIELYRVDPFLESLRAAGGQRAIMTLLEVTATYIDIEDPYRVASGMRIIREADARAAQITATLLERDPAVHADLARIPGVIFLLQELKQAGVKSAVETLATRASNGADPADKDSAPKLLKALKDVGAAQAVARFDDRMANAGQFPERFAPFGRELDGRASLPWTWLDLADES